MTEPLRNWTIYQGASDVAAPFAVREWHIYPGSQPFPAGRAIPAQSLQEARGVVPAGLYRFPRMLTDDRTIVETWM